MFWSMFPLARATHFGTGFLEPQRFSIQIHRIVRVEQRLSRDDACEARR